MSEQPDMRRSGGRPPTPKYEYRVRWRRAERRSSTAVYQSFYSACGKSRRVLIAEAVKDETRLATMPPLVEGPVVERRVVGDWESAPFTEMSPISESEKRDMIVYLGPESPPFGDELAF